MWLTIMALERSVMMMKRIGFYGVALFGLIVSMMVRPSLAQEDAATDFLTVQAGVESLFTATAQAEAYSTFALTVESAFRQTQTATNAPSPTGTPLSSGAMTMTDAARLLTEQAQPTANPAELGDIIGSELVYVQGGQPFQMGTTPQEILDAVEQCVNVEGGDCLVEFGEDSVPAHEVTVSTFQIERTEVTYRQYLAFLNALGPNSHVSGCNGPCITTQQENENSNVTFDGSAYLINGLIENYPMTYVTWFGAEAYCRAIGRRLPTEAEWELAARGYDGRIYPWGNEWDPSLARTSIPPENVGAVPVGSYFVGASPSGALDMAGNVAEWVNDWYDPTYYQQVQASGLNPQGPINGDVSGQRVIRGGSWDAKPFFARSVHRQSAEPVLAGAWLGFRCATDSDITPTPRATGSAVPVATQPASPAARPTTTPTVDVTPVG
jgi:formylglycine-generating enzyme required for sulfatase activity